MVLTLTGRISARDALLDTDLRHLGSFETDQGQFLYAATGQNGGLSVYQVDAGGKLASLADSTYFDVSGLGMGRFDIVETGGTAKLVLHGVGDGALIGYAIEDDGSLAQAATMDLPGMGRQTPSSVAAWALSAGRSALYMVDADTGGIDAWIADSTGSITAEAQLVGAPAHYTLDPAAVLTVTEAGGNGFLLAADARSQGVSCYAIDAATGGLTRTDTLGAADGLGVAVPTALETITAHGTTWAILAAAGSSSLSVMEVLDDGTLQATDHVIDTRATRFAGVTALEVIEADGHVFVLAGGADDGLSLFTLLPDGRLVHLQSLAEEAGLGLDNVTGIEAVRTGSQIQVFVTCGGDAGLSQFALDLDSLGAVLDGSNLAGGGAMAGTGAGDIILGAGDKPLISGGAGDDILISGSGGAVMAGGEGADTFVLSPTDDTLRILDFERGTDRLDLSFFPMLRSLDQLSLEPTSTGIWVRFGDTEIKVISADGRPLSAADLWPGGFDTPDRIALPADAGPDTAGPTPGDDVLRGSAGNDLLRGLGGADRLSGLAGDDRLLGGPGDDLLSGGRGDDRLSGHAGRDRLLGGAGEDVLKGGGGDDRLLGHAGADRIVGQAGNDRITGGAGDDVLGGGGGDDRLRGGTGADRLAGAVGNDRLSGGTGDDRLSGGIGRDLLVGSSGDDQLSGQAGNDRLIGGTGADILDGGKGADWIEGGGGDDRLTGGGGRDRFVYGEDHGDDYIADFDPAQDQIRFEIPGLSHADLQISAVEDGTLIDTGEGTILLEGVDPEDLDPAHFLFT